MALNILEQFNLIPSLKARASKASQPLSGHRLKSSA